jgi:hypothetical protein
MPDSIFTHHSVALVTFHHEGTVFEYNCCRSSKTINVLAAEFERELQAAGRSFHSERRVQNFEGAWVLDMRTAMNRHGDNCFYEGPLLDTMLSGDSESQVGEFGPGAVSKGNQSRSSGLHWVSLTPYIAHRRGLGARVGQICDRVVVWEGSALTAEFEKQWSASLLPAAIRSLQKTKGEFC